MAFAPAVVGFVLLPAIGSWPATDRSSTINPLARSDRSQRLEETFRSPATTRTLRLSSLRGRSSRSTSSTLSRISFPARSALNYLPQPDCSRRGRSTSKTRFRFLPGTSNLIAGPALPLGVSPPPDHNANPSSGSKTYLRGQPVCLSLPDSVLVCQSRYRIIVPGSLPSTRLTVP
jgi:hypothetical protein